MKTSWLPPAERVKFVINTVDNIGIPKLLDMFAESVLEPPKKCDVSGYIYLLQDGDDFKIGRTVDLKKRVSMIQVGNPRKIDLVYSKKSNNPQRDEERLHQKLGKYLTRGEWFSGVSKICLIDMIDKTVK